MKEIELSRLEKAILILAEHAELCPFNDYKVSEEVRNALEVEWVPAQSNVGNRPKASK